MNLMDRFGGTTELINQARTAAYLANQTIAIPQIASCTILPYGGCQNYTMDLSCVPESGGWADLPGTAGNYMTVPDAAALDIVGDLCIVARIAPDDWTPAAIKEIAAKWVASPQQSWQFQLLTDGRLQIAWSSTGSNTLTSTSSANLSALANGAWKWVAFTLDVNNGASGNSVRFWTSDNGHQWTQLGTTIVTAGVTSIFSSTSLVEIGSVLGGTTFPFSGNIQHLSIRNGIGTAGVVGGTVVFALYDNNFLGVAPAATSMVAFTGQTITINHSGGTPTVIVPYVAEHDVWAAMSFNTPTADPAPWYNAAYPESAEALGFYVEEWTGLDDKHVTRAMTRTGRDRGGAAGGVTSNRERVMKLNIFMFANSEEGMAYLFRWFAALLESVCSSCEANTILIRDFCGDIGTPAYGIRELRDVALIEGLGWEADIQRSGRCFLRRASFTLAAGDPCMYTEATAPVVTPGSSSLGPGLLTANYSLTRSPARPSCSELPTTTRQVYSWAAESAMGAKAPVITFYNDNAEHAFPFRAVVYYDPTSIGATPNPCGLQRLGEIYVRPMPPYSYVKWDVAGREIQYRDPTTGTWTESWFLIESNEGLPRYFVDPCVGQLHLALEPGTLAIERIGGTGNVFEWNGITFSSPHYPDVDVAVQERSSCA